MRLQIEPPGWISLVACVRCDHDPALPVIDVEERGRVLPPGLPTDVIQQQEPPLPGAVAEAAVGPEIHPAMDDRDEGEEPPVVRTGELPDRCPLDLDPSALPFDALLEQR